MGTAVTGSVVAVVPARGGSRGVPGKNLARVGGVPLVARAVQAARAAALVDSVLVSTDDREIAACAKAAGAVVVFRPAELAGDAASSESAVLHATHDSAAEVVVLIQCTSPFISADDIDGVVAPVLSGRADTAFTAAVSHGFLWRPDGSGINHDAGLRARRQDRPAELLETGAAYAMTLVGLRRQGHRFFGRVLPVEVDAARTLEIDEPGDLLRAQALAAVLDPHRSAWPCRTEIDAIVFDFDGTMTDDRVSVDQHGHESVVVHRGDGLGIAALRRAGVALLILSSERNPVVAARAAKLGVPVLHGVDAKGAALTDWCGRRAIELTRTAYVGNDVNDLPCLRLVGWPIAVADAHESVRMQARAVTTTLGGHGAVREIASRLLGKDFSHGLQPPALHR